MPRIKKFIWTIRVVIILLAAGAAALTYTKRHDLMRTWEKAMLPPPMEYNSSTQLQPTTSPSHGSKKLTSTTNVPPEVNLAVPFIAQAPHANWELPYKEFCEEASVLMAARYLSGKEALSPEEADNAMQAIKTFEEERFGYYEDTTAEETTIILKEYFNLEPITLLENPTAADIKQALSLGHPVIMPAAGRLLNNPYFQQPGPLYHMLIIKGYTDQHQFIVNDPGTRRGADFLYDEQNIMDAIHDWRQDQNVERGRKIVIVVG